MLVFKVSYYTKGSFFFIWFFVIYLLSMKKIWGIQVHNWNNKYEPYRIALLIGEFLQNF